MSKKHQNKDGQGPQRQRKKLSDETVRHAKSEICYDVGYKRPPKATRFRKGQSGNPNGRPKGSDTDFGGSRSANALALKEAERLITVREDGELRQISAIEAVYRAQYGAAVKGNAYAQKNIIERHDHAERERRQQILEQIEQFERYAARYRKMIADAECKGEAPPTLLPHPDDVVIDRETGLRFLGPVNEEETAKFEEICRMRDVLIMQDGLDKRAWDGPESDDLLDGPGAALLIAMLLNNTLPDRFKLGECEITRRTMLYANIPKRQLLKKVYRGWRSLGQHRPRGKLFPALRVGKAKMGLIFELLRSLSNGRLDPANSTLEETAIEIQAIILERQQEME